MILKKFFGIDGDKDASLLCYDIDPYADILAAYGVEGSAVDDIFNSVWK